VKLDSLSEHLMTPPREGTGWPSDQNISGTIMTAPSPYKHRDCQAPAIIFNLNISLEGKCKSRLMNSAYKNADHIRDKDGQEHQEDRTMTIITGENNRVILHRYMHLLFPYSIISIQCRG